MNNQTLDLDCLIIFIHVNLKYCQTLNAILKTEARLKISQIILIVKYDTSFLKIAKNNTLFRNYV